MTKSRPLVSAAVALLTLALAGAAAAGEPIRLGSSPALTPDGATLVFTWAGDLWSVPSGGGTARRLTTAGGLDAFAAVSPDGTTIAFSGDRGRGRQVFLMPLAGGEPHPITFDTNGFTVEGFTDGGRSLLVRGASDRFWWDSRRFYEIAVGARTAPRMLFDAYGYDGALSPDGERLLFTREGAPWWRKGYRGSQAAQIWLYDRRTKTFSAILRDPGGCRSPHWLPDGKSFVYVGVSGGAFNLVRYDLETGTKTPLTGFRDDSVVSPAVSADGSTIVFRHLFDFYRLRPGVDAKPVRLDIENPGPPAGPRTLRRQLTRAEAAAFSADGLEIAFVAGGDLYVMDTVLREPIPITETPEEESDPVFLSGDRAILFVSGAGGQSDVWKAERADPDRYWWRSRSFRLTKITDDPAPESELSLSPDRHRIAFVRGAGDLVTADPDGGNEHVVLHSFNAPGYAWSPDSKWLTYAVDDSDFNRDIWIVPADGSAPAVNVSRHPDNEWSPTFSPDGRLLAFVGRRTDQEVDIHYVWLRKEDEEASRRDRSLESAIDKMKKGRPGKKPAAPSAGAAGAFRIDFDRIAERIHTIPIPDSTEGDLFWSPDGKRLAFTAVVDGKKGVYTVTFPDGLHPRLLTTTIGSGADWVKDGNRIRWLVRGVPAVTSATGSTETYAFQALQVVDVPGRYQAAFDLVWRTMRDSWYDPALNHRDWDAVRRKYEEMAAASPDRATFERVVELMLGELNGSHLGFSARPEPNAGGGDAWTEKTVHLGVRFAPDPRGPGLRIRDVIPGGPAEKAGLAPGEVILAVNGSPVAPGLDPTLYLNQPPGREVELEVRDARDEKKVRTVRYVPTDLGTVLRLLYDDWVQENRKRVDELSHGRLGYVHIRGMNWSSFHEFEREIYDVGYGKDGLVIDIRNNGGGFTTDHLLTILTQPRHAFTVPRGGEPGYPQDRMVYATWSKPIVVLVNQNSFSNAEIFAHAIQTLHRGKLVGVPTAGGVISTGGMRILDIGFLRTPARGWFILPGGEDMELDGAVPEVLVWPEPGELPRGVDRQLDRAVGVLAGEVKEARANPRPPPRYASSRPGRRR